MECTLTFTSCMDLEIFLCCWICKCNVSHDHAWASGWKCLLPDHHPFHHMPVSSALLNLECLQLCHSISKIQKCVDCSKFQIVLCLAQVGTSVDLARSKVWVTQGFWWQGLAQGLLGKGQGFKVKSREPFLSRAETYRDKESSEDEVYS